MFWKSASGSGSAVLKDPSTLRHRAFFHNLTYISGESDRIFMKILPPMYPSIRKFPLNFGSNPDQESRWRVLNPIRTPDPDRILLGGRMRSLTAFVYSLKEHSLTIAAKPVMDQ